MPRILIFAPMVGRGGIQRVIEKLTPTFPQAAKPDWEWAILSQTFNEIGERIHWPHGVSWFQVRPTPDLPHHPYLFPFLMEHAPAFYAHLQAVSGDYDLIWCPTPWWAMDVPQWDIRTPLVSTVFDLAFDHIDLGMIGDYFRLQARRIAQRSARTIFPSRFQRDYGQAFYGFERTAVIPHSADFIPTDFPVSSDGITAFREVYDLPERWILAFHCTYHKDPITILRAYHAARQESPDVPPLVMAGVQTDLYRAAIPFDAHVAQVQRLIVELDLRLDHDLFILGPVADAHIGPLYAGASAALIASQSEGDVPAGAFEAIATLTPLIYSQLPAIVERLGSGPAYGLSFPVGDVEALSAAIIEVCNWPQAAADRANRAYDWSQQRHVQDVAREYLKVFEEVIA